MNKPVCKVLIRQLHGAPQLIGWCHEGLEATSILRLNKAYKIYGDPMFIVETICHLNVEEAIEMAHIGDEFDKEDEKDA